jgi:hypothetical protein
MSISHTVVAGGGGVPAPGSRWDTPQHRTWVDLGYCPYVNWAGTWCNDRTPTGHHQHWAHAQEPGGRVVQVRL